MSTYTRPVMLLLCGLLLLTVCLAVLNTLVPLWLNSRHLPVWQVGAVGSAYFSGNLLGTLIAGRLIRRYGFNRCYYLAALLLGIASGALALSTEIWSWGIWRFIAGIGCALIWVVVESALLCSGHERNRGQLLAAYMVAYYIGSVAGQLLLSVVPTDLFSVLPWVLALVVMAVIPLLFARLVSPSQSSAPHTPLLRMLRYRSARLGIQGCVISGVILGSLYGLLPLYLAHQGVSNAHVGYWMALLIIAGILGQWPIGQLADRYGRLLVLRVLVAGVILGALVMLIPGRNSMAPALLLLGGAGFALYPVAMSWACEQTASHELVAMNQALLLSYTLGSLCGPGFAAILMQTYSDKLLFVLLAAVSLCYLVLLLKKSSHHPHPQAI